MKGDTAREHELLQNIHQVSTSRLAFNLIPAKDKEGSEKSSSDGRANMSERIKHGHGKPVPPILLVV